MTAMKQVNLVGTMELAGGKSHDNNGTHPCVNFLRSPTGFYKQVVLKAKAIRTELPVNNSYTSSINYHHNCLLNWEWLVLPARAWSWLLWWGCCCCTCVVFLKVSELDFHFWREVVLNITLRHIHHQTVSVTEMGVHGGLKESLSGS